MIFFRSNFSRCVCTKWSFPVHGRPIGHWIGCCLCIITWIDVLASNNSTWCRSLLSLFVRRSSAFQRFLIVWHTKNRSQSRKSSKLWRTEVRSSQFVSVFHKNIYVHLEHSVFSITLKLHQFSLQSHVNLYGYIEHFHSYCEHTCRTRRKSTTINSLFIQTELVQIRLWYMRKRKNVLV